MKLSTKYDKRDDRTCSIKSSTKYDERDERTCSIKLFQLNNQHSTPYNIVPPKKNLHKYPNSLVRFPVEVNTLRNFFAVAPLIMELI